MMKSVEDTRIQAILDCYKAIDSVGRGDAYRKEGWANFDPKTPTYMPSQAEIKRMRRT